MATLREEYERRLAERGAMQQPATQDPTIEYYRNKWNDIGLKNTMWGVGDALKQSFVIKPSKQTEYKAPAPLNQETFLKWMDDPDGSYRAVRDRVNSNIAGSMETAATSVVQPTYRGGYDLSGMKPDQIRDTLQKERDLAQKYDQDRLSAGLGDLSSKRTKSQLGLELAEQEAQKAKAREMRGLGELKAQAARKQADYKRWSENEGAAYEDDASRLSAFEHQDLYKELAAVKLEMERNPSQSTVRRMDNLLMNPVVKAESLRWEKRDLQNQLNEQMTSTGAWGWNQDALVKQDSIVRRMQEIEVELNRLAPESRNLRDPYGDEVRKYDDQLRTLTASPVDNERIRQYREQLAEYDAQEKAMRQRVETEANPHAAKASAIEEYLTYNTLAGAREKRKALKADLVRTQEEITKAERDQEEAWARMRIPFAEIPDVEKASEAYLEAGERFDNSRQKHEELKKEHDVMTIAENYLQIQDKYSDVLSGKIKVTPEIQAALNRDLADLGYRAKWLTMSNLHKFGTWLGDRVKMGFHSFNRGVYGLTDMAADVLGVSHLSWSDQNKRDIAELQRYIDIQAELTSEPTNIAGEITSAAVRTLPTAVMAILSGGTSLPATATKDLSLAGTSSATQVLSATKEMIKSPGFIHSAMDIFGSNYAEETANGVDTAEAIAKSIWKAAAGAMIEVGGGYQTADAATAAWKTAIEEGLEEVTQGVSDRTVDLSFSGKNFGDITLEDIVSLDNPEAIASGIRALEEFGMGAAVGGLLGGGQSLINKGLEYRAAVKYDKALIQHLNQVQSNFDTRKMGSPTVEGPVADLKALAAKFAPDSEIGKQARAMDFANPDMKDVASLASKVEKELSLAAKNTEAGTPAHDQVRADIQKFLDVSTQLNSPEVIKKLYPKLTAEEASIPSKTHAMKNLKRTLDKGAAQAMAEHRAANTSLDDADYAYAFEAAYTAGRFGYGEAFLEHSSAVNSLDKGAKKAAFEAGAALYEKGIEHQKKQAAELIMKMRKPGHGKIDFGEDIKFSKLSEAQKSHVRVLGNFAKTMGFDIEVFASKPDDQGRLRGENGSFNPVTGRFRFDINAGMNTTSDAINYALPAVMGHELTHYLKATTPELYQEIQGVVIKQLADNGNEIDGLIHKKINRSIHGEVSYEAAMDEVIADGLSHMLQNSQAMQRIAADNPTLFTRIKDWVTRFVERIKTSLSNREPMFEESKSLMEMRDGTLQYMGNIQQLWDDALVESHRRRMEAPRETAPKAVESVKAKEPATKPASSGGVVYTADNQPVRYRYELVGIDDLVASNNTDMSINEAYPAELQPRDRTRAASHEQINRIASNLNPVLLGESADVGTGAPFVGPDLVVESGNGRVMALRMALERFKDSAKGYTKWLRENAASFGFVPNDVKNDSVLVRVREGDADFDRVSFVQKSNQSAVAAYSETENAAQDAGKLSPGLLATAEVRGGELNTAGNSSFIVGFLEDVVPANERGAFVDANGNISQRGLLRMRNALFQRAYNNDRMTAQLAEVTDATVKNVVKAMTNVAPRIALMAEDVKKGRLNDVLPVAEIVEAYETYKNLKENGGNVPAFLAQYPMFEMEGAAARALVEMFEDNKRSAVAITDAFNAILDKVKQYGNPNQMTLPGIEMVKPDAEMIVRQGIEEAKAARDTVAASERFSMREPVEDNGQLIAVHNLTEQKLMSAFELGGFPMPSIAITKPEMGHDNFGNISVLFGKDTIDPEQHYYNRVYSQDAWTPTFPNVAYEISGNKASKIYMDNWYIQKEDGFNFGPELHPDNLSDAINDSGGDVVSAVADTSSLKYEYLKSVGELDRIQADKSDKSAYEIALRRLEMKDDLQYLQWVRDKFDGVVGRKGIRNKKDPFTPSGNRRSFSQLYDDYTLDNIIRVMRQGDQTAASSFATPLTAIGTQFESVEDIKSESSRIRYDENVEKTRDALRDELWNVASNIAGQNASFGVTDGVLDEITEAVRKGYLTAAKLKSHLNRVNDQYKLGYNVDDAYMKDLAAVLKKAQRLPVKYFEAKPARAVRFDEVRAVILPEDASQQVKDALADRGIPVVMYDAYSKESRLDALNSPEAQAVRFSERELNVEPFSKETLNNIKVRGDVVVLNRVELMEHIEQALLPENKNKKLNLYVGAINNETKAKMETESKQKLFTKSREYAFSVSYDDIQHMDKHFKDVDGKIDAIEKVYGMLKNFDEIEAYKTASGEQRIRLKKTFPDADYLTINLIGNQRRAVDLVTIYITKMHITKGGQSVPRSTGDIPGGHLRGSSASTNIIPTQDADSQLRFSERDYAPPMYSKMQREIEAYKDDKIGANSVIKYLLGRGVKADEIRWSGIQPFLDGKKSVTKAELLEFVRGNELWVEDVSYGGAKAEIIGGKGTDILVTNPFYRPGDRYNSQEYLLALEYDEATNTWSDINGMGYTSLNYDEAMLLARGFNVDPDHETRYKSYATEGGTNYREILFTLPKVEGEYQSDHWNEKNVLAHTRLQDFEAHDGGRVLFVDEVQSDWHQEGRDKGYRGDSVSLKEANARLNDVLGRKEAALRRIVGDVDTIPPELMDAVRTESAKYQQEIDDAERAVRLAYKEDSRKVTTAPFATTWHEYVMKRVLRMAAEGGYDYVGWTTGQMQADRYKLTYYIDKIITEASTDGRYFVSIYALDGSRLYGISGEYTAEKIIQVFGKDLGNRMLDERNFDKYDLNEISGAGLEIGGEGMKAFYDIGGRSSQNIPRFLNKYGKQWGAQVQTIDMQGAGGEQYTVPGMKINERMKDSVLYEGQPLYSERDPDTLPSPRAILAGAFGEVAQTAGEQKRLDAYRKQVDRLNYMENVLLEKRAELRELNKRRADQAERNKVRTEIKELESAIHSGDKVLMGFEMSKPLREIVNRERDKVYNRMVQESRDRVAGYRDRTQGTIARRKKREYVISRVKKLDKLLRYESDQKHIPQGFKGPVLDFLQVFTDNTSVFDYKRLARVKEAYDSLAKSGTLSDTDLAGMYDFEIAEDLKLAAETMEGRRLSELDDAELDRMKTIADHFLHIVRNENEIFLQGRRQRVSELGAKGMENYRSKAKEYSLAITSGNGPVASFLKLIKSGNARPVNFFNRVGGVMDDLFGDIMEGQNKWAFGMQSARDYFLAVVKKYNYNAWSDVKGDEFVYRTKAGDDIKLTREQALALYATDKRAKSNPMQDAKHLEIGGFVYEDAVEVKKKVAGIPIPYEVNTAKNHPLVAEDIAAIFNWLTPEQKAYADEMVRYMSQDMGALGNETSMELFGTEKYGEPYYFPYESASNYLYRRQGAVENDNALKHRSFTKRTVVNANNPIVLRNFTDVWAGHVQNMLMYNALAVPLDNFNRVYNYKDRGDAEAGRKFDSVKAALESAYGKDATKYINKLIDDLNISVRPDTSEQFGRKMTSLFKKTAVLANLSVALQQFSAIGRAWALIDPKYFRKGYTKAGYQEMMKYSGVAVIKEMGRFDTNMGRSSADWLIAKEYDTIGEKTKAIFKDSGYRDDLLGAFPQKADEMTWTTIWEAVKREQVAKGKNPGSATFLQDVAKRFNEVIEYTQVYDSVLTRSEAMRSDSMYLQMLTSFMAEPTVSINMLQDTIMNRNNPDAKIKPNAARVVAMVAAGKVINAMLKSLATAARDDDEKYTYLEKYVNHFGANLVDELNPLNMIPYLRDVVSITQGWNVDRADVNLVKDIYKGYKVWYKDVPISEKVVTSAGGFFNLLGVPLKNAYRDARAIYNVFANSAPLSQTTASGLKISLLEGLSIYDSSKGSWHRRLYEAILEGDAEKQAEARTTLAKKGDDDKKIQTGLRKIIYTDLEGGRIDAKEAMRRLVNIGGLKETTSKISEWYKDGDISRDEAADLLKLYAKKNEPQEIYRTLQGWDAKKEDPEAEYRTMDKFYQAVATGKDLRKVVEEYTDPQRYGYKESYLKSQITDYFKPLYIETYNRSRSDASTMKGYLLNAYVMLGDKRSKRSKLIDAWLKDK